MQPRRLHGAEARILPTSDSFNAPSDALSSGDDGTHLEESNSNCGGVPLLSPEQSARDGTYGSVRLQSGIAADAGIGRLHCTRASCHAGFEA